MMKRNVCGKCGGETEHDRLAILDTPICSKCAAKEPGNILFREEFTQELVTMARTYAKTQRCETLDEEAVQANAFADGYRQALKNEITQGKRTPKGAKQNSVSIKSVNTVIRLESQLEEIEDAVGRAHDAITQLKRDL